jgi:hypothetical protein
MPIVTYIPRAYKDGFKELVTLDEESFKSIISALQNAPLSSSHEDLAVKIAVIATTQQSVIEQILLSISGLISFLEDEEDINEVVEDIVELAAQEPEINVQGKDQAQFKERLLLLLSDKKIFYASKAQDLITETENQFLTCRIVTDFRPIFNLNIEKSIEAGMIIHNLHIHYQGKMSGQHQDIYLSLNANDIGQLLDVIGRAIKKEENLREVLLKSSITNLNE